MANSQWQPDPHWSWSHHQKHIFLKILFLPYIDWVSSLGIKSFWNGRVSPPFGNLQNKFGLSATLFSTWDMVTASLQSCGIMCGGQSDHLYWFTPNVSASVRVKDIYSELITSKVSGSACMFPMALWEIGCPLRMIFFAWLVFKNRNLT